MDTNLYKSIVADNLEMVKELVYEENIDEALYLAAQYGRIKIVKYLVEQGANVNDGDALRWASFVGHLEVAKFLVDNGANVNLIKNPEIRKKIDKYLEMKKTKELNKLLRG